MNFLAARCNVVDADPRSSSGQACAGMTRGARSYVNLFAGWYKRWGISALNGGRLAGEFHYLHQVSVDSKGNIYTGEVDTAKRIQKFLRYGGTGCSGSGFSTVGGVLDAK